MKDEDKALAICKEFDKAVTAKSQYERPWQEIRELVRPNAMDFYNHTTKGEVRTETIFDGTAPQSLEELASALHSYMVSPTERWFGLRIPGDMEINKDQQVLEWLENVSDIIYDAYSDDRSSFNSAVFETFLDIGAFGNTVLNQEWNEDDDCLCFRATPLAAVYFEEDQYGKIDKVFIKHKRTKRQLIQQFGEEVLPEKVSECTDDNREYDLIHKVCPRRDVEYGKLGSTNMRFQSCWVLHKPSALLKESGYTSFPYHAARWSKVAGEIYGRGPAIKCLPDIKMLNRMEFNMIKAVQKAVDPPLIAESDGIMLPIKTSPGSINFVDPGRVSEAIMPLEHKGNIPVGMEFSEQKRQFIQRCFYADWVKLMPKKERQTAYEISELVEQQLRMMAPMLGRLQTELLGPLLIRSYDLLSQKNKLPPAPEQVRNRSIQPIYISPAARAQLGSKAMVIGRYIQEIIPLTQFDPTVMNGINMPKLSKKLAQLRGVDPEVLRSDDEIEELAAQQQAQQQAQALVAAAEPASKAVKNLSDANEAGNIF